MSIPTAEELPSNKRTVAILIAIIVFMTCFAYVAGLMSHNFLENKKAQEECYAWLETECPCIFADNSQRPDLVINISWGSLNNTGGK